MELPPVVQALLTPEAYPHYTYNIELVQTQISFVLLTGNYVYKIKKSVDFGFLDYTTLEKRRYYCHQEVILNRRLCPQVYLGVSPVIQRSGGIFVGGRGKVLEYAVQMRQLPQEAMMDHLLREGRVTKEMVKQVAQRLVEFHQRAETNEEIRSFGEPEILRRNTEENFDQTEKYVGITILKDRYEAIRDFARSFIQTNLTLFEKRIREGRIRDCHGDVHAANVCFSDGICIYDCIEFNERFRYSDVVGDVAFLAMDLDYYGWPALSRTFVSAYIEMSQDSEMSQLLNFTKCYRAYVRGKVESFKLDDPHITSAEKEQVLTVAKRYFDLAYGYTTSRDAPLLIITCGLIGTGKSTIAQELARRMDLVVIASDVVRKSLAQVPMEEHRFEEFGGGIYSPNFTRQTYAEVLNQAREHLAQGRSVIIDASFRKQEERRYAQRLATDMGAEFWVIECVSDETTIKKRLEQRRSIPSISDGRWEIFAEIKGDFEPVTEVLPQNHLAMNTSRQTKDVILEILNRINRF